jgi:NAD(P)-dependent dehydrogenase (short-subunit alcohol dehydrogenase family)
MTRPVAFVTGASRGIGAATALALAGKGYDVAIAARTLHDGERHEHGDAAGGAPLPGSLDATAARLRDLGARALPLRLDLLDPSSLDAAVAECEKQLGAIDALVNNAIVQLPGMMARALEIPLDAFARILQGNVVAQLQLVQRVLPGMLARRHGAIVNLVSASGAMDPPAPTGEGGWGFAYSASKAAFMRLTGVLAVEHRGSGVRFFDVEPGFVLTELMQQSALRSGFAERFGGAPPEVPAAVIAWLLTDPAAASWHGRMVSAQKLCKELRLVSGWPVPRPSGDRVPDDGGA